MPYEVSVDAERRIVNIRMWGVPTPGEVRTLVSEGLKDSRWAPDFMQLADLRELTSAGAFTAADIRAIAAGALVPSPKRAIVVQASVMFGLARMFVAMRNLSDVNEEIGVFRTMKEAEDWLGLAGV